MFRTILMLMVEFFLLLVGGCAGDGGAADGMMFRGRDISAGEVYFGYSSEDRPLIEDEELRSGVLELISEADSRQCKPDWSAGSYIHCDYGEIIVDGEYIEIGCSARALMAALTISECRLLICMKRRVISAALMITGHIMI